MVETLSFAWRKQKLLVSLTWSRDHSLVISWDEIDIINNDLVSFREHEKESKKKKKQTMMNF